MAAPLLLMILLSILDGAGGDDDDHHDHDHDRHHHHHYHADADLDAPVGENRCNEDNDRALDATQLLGGD